MVLHNRAVEVMTHHHMAMTELGNLQIKRARQGMGLPTAEFVQVNIQHRKTVPGVLGLKTFQ
jgi:hypothetical protein